MPELSLPHFQHLIHHRGYFHLTLIQCVTSSSISPFRPKILGLSYLGMNSVSIFISPSTSCDAKLNLHSMYPALLFRSLKFSNSRVCHHLHSIITRVPSINTMLSTNNIHHELLEYVVSIHPSSIQIKRGRELVPGAAPSLLGSVPSLLTRVVT